MRRNQGFSREYTPRHDNHTQMQSMKTLMLYQMWNMMLDLCEQTQLTEPEPYYEPYNEPYFEHRHRRRGNTHQTTQQTPKTQPEEYSRLYEFWKRIRYALTDAEVGDIMDQCAMQGNYKVENKIRLAMEFLTQIQTNLMREAEPFINQQQQEEVHTSNKMEEDETNKEEKEQQREGIQNPKENVVQNKTSQNTNGKGGIQNKTGQNPDGKNVIQNKTNENQSMGKQSEGNHTQQQTQPNQQKQQPTIHSPEKRRDIQVIGNEGRGFYETYGPFGSHGSQQQSKQQPRQMQLQGPFKAGKLDTSPTIAHMGRLYDDNFVTKRRGNGYKMSTSSDYSDDDDFSNSDE